LLRIKKKFIRHYLIRFAMFIKKYPFYLKDLQLIVNLERYALLFTTKVGRIINLCESRYYCRVTIICLLFLLYRYWQNQNLRRIIYFKIRNMEHNIHIFHKNSIVSSKFINVISTVISKTVLCRLNIIMISANG